MPGRGSDDVWKRNDELLDEHLERLADKLDTVAGGYGRYVTTGSEFMTSDCPYEMESDFFGGELSVVVEFRREADQLRYSSRIKRRRRTLREGPAGLVDVSNGLAAASGDIDSAFAKIIAFVDRSESLLRRENPFSTAVGIIPMLRRLWHGD